jgi:hypothetical protein
MYEYLHQAQIANIVTSYCTCLAGIMPLAYCWLAGTLHPKRWMFVYFCVLLTGIPTVWLHAMEGYRLASFADTGSNIFLAWAVQVAVTGDFMQRRGRLRLLTITTAFSVLCLSWMFWEIFAPEKWPLLVFGEFGQFYAGEFGLILNAWVVAGLFIVYWGRVPRASRRLLLTTLGMLIFGMFLATAANDVVTFYILPWHATWHVVSAFALMTMWAFNQLRFFPPRVLESPREDSATPQPSAKVAARA